jgi:hypothetical protein
MRRLWTGFEYALDVSVRGLKHPGPRVHCWSKAFVRHDRATDRGLPFLVLLLGLRQFHDLVGCVLQREQLATVQQVDRVFEWSIPAPLSQSSPAGFLHFIGPASCRFRRNHFAKATTHS